MKVKITRVCDSNFKAGQLVTIDEFLKMCRAILENGGEHPIGIPVPD